MPENLNTLPEMKPIRRKLRRHMTAAEVALWVMVKNRQLVGERFLRQFSIGHYVVDFYCPKYKLGIELDGAEHFTEEGLLKDEKRTDFLKSVGIKIIRFENFEVFEFPLRTLEEIKKNLR